MRTYRISLRVPSGENTVLSTLASLPWRIEISFAVAASHSRALLSSGTVGILVPSGENAAPETPSSWPRRTAISLT
jgi:hypothetical protein